MPLQVALQQRDAGALDGDVGAGAHGDADIGRGQRRRVVDAVAGHGDHAALAPAAAATTAALSSGSTSASTSSMPSCRGDRLGGGAVVAGQHDDAHALGASARGRRRRWSP